MESDPWRRTQILQHRACLEDLALVGLVSPGLLEGGGVPALESGQVQKAAGVRAGDTGQIEAVGLHAEGHRGAERICRSECRSGEKGSAETQEPLATELREAIEIAPQCGSDLVEPGPNPAAHGAGGPRCAERRMHLRGCATRESSGLGIDWPYTRMPFR